MLTVPTFIRAAANGLGGFLGAPYSDMVFTQAEADAAAGNATRPGARRAVAALPPGTVKTPWAAAADAAGNLFGSGVTTPPGTHAEGDVGEETTTSATPPINSSGAPNWGLFVGLGILVIGGGALAWSLWGKKRAAPAANRRRRNGRRRRRNANAITWLAKRVPLHGQHFVKELMVIGAPTREEARKLLRREVGAAWVPGETGRTLVNPKSNDIWVITRQSY